MSQVVAITNQKGGVAKTTTAVNLAASMAASKRKILLVDLDPQGNATMGCGVDKRQLSVSGYDVLVGDCQVDEVIQPANGHFDLLPGGPDLTAAEVELAGAERREFRLRDALEHLSGGYDYIFIDCPPSLNMLTVNALTAANAALIPIQCEYYALEGLSALLETIEQIRRAANPALEIMGLLRTMFDPRNNLANEVSNQLFEYFADKVYRTSIPRNIRLAEAPSYGVPALLHDRHSPGSLAYLALAGEMLKRDNAQAVPA